MSEEARHLNNVIGRGGNLVDDHPFEQCFSAFLIEDI
jgi:hypothetical protein